MVDLLTYSSVVEKQFGAEISPRLEAEFDVRTAHLHHDEAANVLHVDLVLPAGSTRATRHAVLSVLSAFEQESMDAVITSPRFLVAADA